MRSTEAGQGAGYMAFRDVVVAPTESVIGRRTRAEFQGGPLWPEFDNRLHARHCRGPAPKPFDVAPTPPDEVADTLREAVWCGPVCPHFGHAIADFAMRIAESAHRFPALPLLFCTWPGGAATPPPYFLGFLAQFGVAPHRVVLRDTPIRVGTLHVLPQAERLGGPPPRAEYLDLLDRCTPSDRDAELAEATIFVSRSRIHRDTLAGRLAGEAYLDEVLAAAGARVMHPETLPLDEQLRCYRSARRLVFSEGSALHAMQLLGRVRAEVSVLTRRPDLRMARAALRPRAAALHWVDATSGLLRGHHRSGRGVDNSRALAVLDPPVLLARLGEATGLGLARHWDAARFAAASAQDVTRWVRARRLRLRGQAHAASDAAMVAAGLEALGLPPVG